MGRWAVFFVLMFITCNFLASIAEGDTSGGGSRFAITQLTANMSTTAAVAQVTNNADFPQILPVGAYSYIQIDDEIMAYTINPPDSTHLTGIVRGLADPTASNRPVTVAAAHTTGARVRTLYAAAVDSFIGGQQITTSQTAYGSYSAPTFSVTSMMNIYKYITWDYPTLFDHGGGYYVRLFLLYPLSAGFSFFIGYAFLILAMGLFKLI